MSSLGISILILAASAIVAVVAVNLFQALGRRRRLAAAMRPKSGGDAAAAQPRSGATEAVAGEAPAASDRSPARGGAAPRGVRREPRLGDVAVPDGEEPAFEAGNPAVAAAAQGDPVLAGARSANPVRSATPALAPAPQLSPMCDCIVTLPLETPVAGERLIAITQGIRRAGGKPVLFDGVPEGAADDESAVPLAAGIGYRALRMGVLLANRHGPLNAMEYSEFVAGAQALADQLSTLADTPDMADAIARARDLDATCAQLDAQIGLNVDAPEPLGPQQVAVLAAELGLVDRGGHRHARLGPEGELVFTMSLTDSPQRLGFLLDVPRTAESLDGWVAMLDCAQDAASRLSGRVVDDAGRPIPLEALDTIARQLTQRYASLDAIGLPAGSVLALRVFN